MPTVGAIAEAVQGVLLRGDPDKPIARLRTFDDGTEDALLYVLRADYLPRLEDAVAGAVLIDARYAERPEVRRLQCAVIAVRDARLAYARASQLLAPDPVRPAPGVDPRAAVDPSAQIHPDARVGPHVSVGPNAVIGPDAELHAGARVGAHARVGRGTVLWENTVIREGCWVGERCVLQPGAVIGADGFGFVRTASGELVRIAHAGSVVVEDDVEIGAHSCIDRATSGVTRIGRGTKIDNLVQVGHNVQVGPHSVIVAQSGVAGSSRIGAGVTLAAQTGVAGHLTVGDGATVLARAGVARSVAPGQAVLGTPAQPRARALRQIARLSDLEDLVRRVGKLEARARAWEDGAERNDE